MAFHITFSEQMRCAVNIAAFATRQQRYRSDEKVIANTTYGQIKGVKWRSLYGPTYYSFEGIPFAKPPIGDLRFKAPQEPEPWTEIKSCTHIKSRPCQFNLVLNMVQGSEDCLYLNVYTKELNPLIPMPVLVWIYGGGFQMGEASRLMYSPDYIMMENVVLIMLTYRLGPLGFLTLDDPECNVPGNAGLKDQLFALKWVKSNCHYFGGNPNNITIFGESAGAASTHFMMLSDTAKGLFHKAVAMSGTALSPWALTPKSNWAYRLAKATGYRGENVDKLILEHLRNVKPEVLYKKAEKVITMDERLQRKVTFAFGPCIEPYETEYCIIKDTPLKLLPNAWSNRIPLLIGGNSFEGLLVYSEVRKYPELLTKLGNCEYLPPKDANLNEEQRKEYGLMLKKTYFGDAEGSWKTILQYSDLFSYKYFWHSIHRTILARQHYAANTATYLYRFAFDSKKFNFIRNITCGRKIRGTCHADDLSYLFYNAVSKKLKNYTPEFKTIRRMVAILTQFARCGDPNIPNDISDNHTVPIVEKYKRLYVDEDQVDMKTDDPTNTFANSHLEIQQEQTQQKFESVRWLPISPKDNTNFKCLNISAELEVIDLPEKEKLRLWDQMYNDKSLLY